MVNESTNLKFFRHNPHIRISAFILAAVVTMAIIVLRYLPMGSERGVFEVSTSNEDQPGQQTNRFKISKVSKLPKKTLSPTQMNSAKTKRPTATKPSKVYSTPGDNVKQPANLNKSKDKSLLIKRPEGQLKPNVSKPILPGEKETGSTEKTNEKTRKAVKLILFWTTIYNKVSTKEGQARFSGCEFSNCYYTSNRSRLDESDAIIFHMWDLAKHSKKDLPPRRWPHQWWVLYGHESASNANFSLYYDVEFNTTATYKDDADIFFGYGCYSKIPFRAEDMHPRDHSARKTRLVSWVISHCNAESKRDEYIRELSKYIPVDGYGKCAKRVCTSIEETLGRKERSSKVGCEEMIAQTYKFYLAFENSLCDGYITEKAWNKLKYGTVPVVLGASNYTRHLPPNSFIDVRSFPSPKALANYLLKVDKDDSLYNSYFAWRTVYRLTCEPFACKLCSYINTKIERKVYKNIGKWWTQCTDYRTFFNGVANNLI